MNRTELFAKIESKKFSSTVTQAVLTLSSAVEATLPIARRQLANEAGNPHVKYRFSGWPEHGKEIFALMIKFGTSYLTIHLADYAERGSLQKVATANNLDIADGSPVLVRRDGNPEDRFQWEIKADEGWLSDPANLAKLTMFVSAALSKYRR